MGRRAPGFLAALLLACLPAAAGAETLYIEVGRILPGEGDPVEGGAIVVRDGRIRAAGPASEVARPPWSRRVDAGDRVVMPAFVIPASRIGMPSPPRRASRMDAPYRPTWDPWRTAASDAAAFDPTWTDLRRAGVTTLIVLPPSGTGLLGLASALRPGAEGPAGLVLKERAALVIGVARRSAWREKVVAAFEEAREKIEKEEKKRRSAGKNGAGSPPSGGKREEGDPIEGAASGELPLLVDAAGAGEWEALRAALEAAGLDPGDLDLIAVERGDLWRAAPALQDVGVAVLARPVVGIERFTRYPLQRAARFHEAGVPVSFVLADDSLRGARSHLDAMREMHRTGLPREAALAALTSAAAAAVGLEEEVGSIREGRRADLLFLSGDPFDPLTRIDRVMADGEFVDEPDEEAGND